ncbi:MAG: FAD-binding monooxygenase [Rhodobacteraceae bacterium]|nr:FAD-binding monooxygenase [Paracoccaceae bacterium]
MQFHLNGFQTGDPDLHPEANQPAGPADHVDVLIVGSGPAGLTLAAQLAAFPAIRTRIIEQRDGPLLLGQADGVACRSVEMMNAFGFAERLLREAYWVNETTFWGPDQADPSRITRTGIIQDTEDGLSEFPHVILNQARVHDFYLDVMRKSPTRLEVDYSRRLLGLEVLPPDQAGPLDHAVTARIERLDRGHEGEVEVIRARYVVGCDGARSMVRKSIGRELVGDAANKAWGVMDVLYRTDFPDIRKKSMIQSADQGSIVLIPREGGYVTRIYIEMDNLGKDERVAGRNIGIEQLAAAVNRVLHPYSIEVRDVAWWSVYEIGQRLTDKFDDVPEADIATRMPHVFIAGDACHTHSPKAGQGMNVSMRDTFNLGWKLAAVLQGRSDASLLHSYSAERQGVAKMLIDFDREWAAIISARPKVGDKGATGGLSAAEIRDYWIRHGRYTAGTAIRYAPSVITGTGEHQHLATGFEIGMRFHSAPVIRLADAKPVHLGHVVQADGRWRLFAFGDAADPAGPSAIRALCYWLAGDPASPLRRYTPKGADPDAVIDLRAIFQQGHRELEIGDMPALLLPEKGCFGVVDYEKMFCPDLKSGQDIFQMRGIDRDQGCMVIVRPDQHVGHVLPLDGYGNLADFFAGIMLDT